MSIKVLVISNYTDYHSVRPEASIFLGLAKLGFEVHIMTYGDAAYVEEFKAAGINVIDFHPEKKFDKEEVAFIRQTIIDKQIDIVHLFNSISSVNGIRAAKGLPVKVVLYRGYAGNINWYNPAAYLKYLNPRVDKIFCNSIGVEHYIQSQLFFDKSKTITINKGHDVAWYENYAPHDIRTELGIDKDAFLLVNVANNRSMKGIPYLLKTINMLPPDLPIHLLLVGRNMDNATNLNTIKNSPNKDKVHFLGFRTDVLNIVASCNVFTLSSIKGESITKSVIEAMSLSIAPIITDIPGNVELVEDGVSGLVTPVRNSKSMADAIMKLYNDRDLCTQLGRAAKARINNELNYKKTIEKTAQMYRDLLV